MSEHWAILTSRASSEKRRIDSLLHVFACNDRRLPSFVLKSLEAQPISGAWFDALVGVSETLPFDSKLLAPLAKALASRLREHAAADNEATWAAIRRLASLLLPDRASEFAELLDDGVSVGNRLTATQALARTLAPATGSEAIAKSLASTCQELLSRERSPTEGALLMNALAALGATGDPSLTALLERVGTSTGSIFPQQVRTRLASVGNRLQERAIPQREWAPLATALGHRPVG